MKISKLEIIGSKVIKYFLTGHIFNFNNYTNFEQLD